MQSNKWDSALSLNILKWCDCPGEGSSVYSDWRVDNLRGIQYKNIVRTADYLVLRPFTIRTVMIGTTDGRWSAGRHQKLFA